MCVIVTDRKIPKLLLSSSANVSIVNKLLTVWYFCFLSIWVCIIMLRNPCDPKLEGL